MKSIKCIVIILLALSCKNDNSYNSESIEELIQVVANQNNYVLNIYRDANRYILKTHDKSSGTCKINLDKLNQLYRLNNSEIPSIEKLKKFIEGHNETVKPDKSIDITTLNNLNRIDYYLLIHRVIENGNYSPGSVNEPRLLLPYAINNFEFHAFAGDTIKVPIKSFSERDMHHSRYELVDTLNFTKVNDNEGYFSVSTKEMKIGTSNEKLVVYGRNIYTNEIDEIGTSFIKCVIHKKE